MLLILSECGDVSTDYAIEWLRYYHLPFVRVNDDHFFSIISSIEFKGANQSIEFNVSGHIFAMDDITDVWFRRGNIRFYLNFAAVSDKDEAIKQQVFKLLQQENETMAQYIVTQLAAKRSLNNQFHYNANKLLTLMHASRVGLNVPHTLITGNKNDIEKINQDVSQVITKPIQDVFELKIGNSVQTQRTETVANFSTIPDRFYYSLFQEKITKKYELRVFFIEEAFYACAIFSPAIDGRDLYSEHRLARIVPYKLPKHLQEKLVALNKLINLNCGSIDIMVDEKNDHYFLEVNPVGQYDYVSKSGNYYLDKRIAQYFKNEEATI